MAAQEQSFRQIDNALAAYYHRLGTNNYINRKRNGKFMQYVIDEEFIDPDLPIETELGPISDLNNCVYIDFIGDTNEFPVPMNVSISNENKSAYIFLVLQHCWIYGHPPSNQFIKQYLVPTLDGSIHSATVGERFHYMLGFVSGWLFTTGLCLDYYIGMCLWFQNELIVEEQGIIELEEGEALSVQSDWEDEDGSH